MAWHFEVLFPALRRMEVEMAGGQHSSDAQRADTDRFEVCRQRALETLVSLHCAVSLRPAPLYLAVRLLDRYLEQLRARPQGAQPAEVRSELLALGALAIAGKFEGDYAISYDELLGALQAEIKAEEIHGMEVQLLRTLQYRLNMPVVWHHLPWFLDVVGASVEQRAVAEYVSEVGLTALDLPRWRPSEHAAAAVLLVGRIEGAEEWPRRLATSFSAVGSAPRLEGTLQVLAALRRALRKADAANPVYRKFSAESYGGLAPKLAKRVARACRTTPAGKRRRLAWGTAALAVTGGIGAAVDEEGDCQQWAASFSGGELKVSGGSHGCLRGFLQWLAGVAAQLPGRSAGIAPPLADVQGAQPGAAAVGGGLLLARQRASPGTARAAPAASGLPSADAGIAAGATNQRHSPPVAQAAPPALAVPTPPPTTQVAPPALVVPLADPSRGRDSGLDDQRAVPEGVWVDEASAAPAAQPGLDDQRAGPEGVVGDEASGAPAAQPSPADQRADPEDSAEAGADSAWWTFLSALSEPPSSWFDSSMVDESGQPADHDKRETWTEASRSWYAEVIHPALCQGEGARGLCLAEEPWLAHREKLVEWVIRIHISYQLRTETLYLAVHLADRYLAYLKTQPASSAKRLARLRLLAAALLCIAAKFEDLAVPDFESLASMSEGEFSKAELGLMLPCLLSHLGFRLHAPLAVHHLPWLLEEAGASKERRDMAEYLCQVGLTHPKLPSWLPSDHAVAAVALAGVATGSTPWPPVLKAHLQGAAGAAKSETVGEVLCALAHAAAHARDGCPLYEKYSTETRDFLAKKAAAALGAYSQELPA